MYPWVTDQVEEQEHVRETHALTTSTVNRGDVVFFCHPRCCVCPPERRVLGSRHLSICEPCSHLLPATVPSLYSFTGPAESIMMWRDLNFHSPFTLAYSS